MHFLVVEIILMVFLDKVLGVEVLPMLDIILMSILVVKLPMIMLKELQDLVRNIHHPQAIMLDVLAVAVALEVILLVSFHLFQHSILFTMLMVGGVCGRHYLHLITELMVLLMNLQTKDGLLVVGRPDLIMEW